MDDTGDPAEWLAEGDPTNSADPTLGNVILGANLISSKVVKVSVQLAQDSFESVEGILSEAFSERIGRTLDTAYMTGDGSTIPVTGFAYRSYRGGRSLGASWFGSNSNDGTGTDLNSVGTDDFSALIDNLDRGYQTPTNRFVFAQSTQNALRKLKDKYGRPVWEVSLAQGEPDKIFGYGYQIDNAMAGIGAGNIPVMFGDFRVHHSQFPGYHDGSFQRTVHAELSNRFSVVHENRCEALAVGGVLVLADPAELTGSWVGPGYGWAL